MIALIVGVLGIVISICCVIRVVSVNNRLQKITDEEESTRVEYRGIIRKFNFSYILYVTTYIGMWMAYVTKNIYLLFIVTAL